MTTQVMSIYVPRVFIQVTEEQLMEYFRIIGAVSHVDFISLSKNGQCYNAAYVHFNWWMDTPFVENFRKSLREKNGARLYYNNVRFYLICRENTGKKHGAILEDILTEPQGEIFAERNKNRQENGRDELARINLDFQEAYARGLERELKVCRESQLTDHGYLAEVEHKNTLYLDEISCLRLENSLLKEQIETFLY